LPPGKFSARRVSKTKKVEGDKLRIREPGRMKSRKTRKRSTGTLKGAATMSKIRNEGPAP